MTMDTAWLFQVCDQSRARLEEPLTLSLYGQLFAVATDGHRLVELPETNPAFKMVPLDRRDGYVKYLTIPPAVETLRRPLDFRLLRAFILSVLTDVVSECSNCDNAGQVIYFTSKGEGPNYATCPKCDGAVVRAKRVYIGGVLFNARLFKPMVENLPDADHVTWRQEAPTQPAYVESDSWRFLVMPFRDELDEVERRQTPRFEIEGAQAAAA
jgi:hypothetical protein